MKYLYKYILSLIFLSLGLVQFKNLCAQNNIYNWQLGFGIGYTNYYGDLSNYRIHGAGELYKIYRFANYNSYYQHQPSLSVLLQKKITPTLGIMFQANYLQFAMSDRYRKNNGTLDTNATNFARSLNFRTTMQDIGFAFTFSPNNGRIGSETTFFYPSFYLGLGVSKFVVDGNLYDAKHNPYNYNLPGTVMDNTYETNLRDQRTEMDSKFRNVEPYVDLGLALNFRLSSRFTLAVQSDIKYSASDYLDDVSSVYKPVYPTAAEAYAAKPGYNVVNPVTMQRGDNNGVNDFYINNRVVLSIALAKKKIIRTFKPPVIYSLNVPSYYYQKKIVDSVKKIISADSLTYVKNDSINKILKDSLSLIKSAVTTLPHQDSVMNKKLDSINADLSVIKNMLHDQQIQPRLLQLQYQSDSVKNLRARFITRRQLSESNGLQVRVYDLQIDSLRNEYEKARRTQNFPINRPDGPILLTRPAGALNGYTTVVTPDTINLDPLGGHRTDLYSAKMKRIDSLQNRLVELETRSADTDRHAETGKTVAVMNASDSLNHLNTKEEDVKLRQKDQEIVSLRQQIGAFEDSAAYYKMLRDTNPAVTEPGSNEKKIPWYQRYFGLGGKNKKRVTTADTLKRVDYASQQRFYESETKLANSKIDDIEKDKAELAAQRLDYARANKLALDSIEFERNAKLVRQRIQQNDATITSLRQQVQRSNDSAAFYKGIALNGNENINSDDTKWYQQIFSSKKKKQARIESENDRQENNLRQQQNYDNDVKNMQNKISDLERRNSDLERASRSDIFFRQAGSFPVTPVVAFGGNNNRTDETEMNDLRAQVQNLQNEINYDARKVPVMDSADTVKRPQIIIVTPPATTPPHINTDSSEITLLKTQLNELRSRLDSMSAKPTPAVAEKTINTPPSFDVTTFPVISVYFKLGSVMLASDQLNKMIPFAQAANKHTNTKIILTGFTDPVGSPEKNVLIANKRSLYIKDILVSKYKISDSRVMIEAPGQTQPANLKKANPLDRRVDLQFK